MQTYILDNYVMKMIYNGWIKTLFFLGVTIGLLLFNGYVYKLFRHNDVRTFSKAGGNSFGEAPPLSGAVFLGKKIRRYNGPTVFSNKEMVSKFIKEYSGTKKGSGKYCKQWAVVTTIFEPSKALKLMADVPDWCLVIVGDKKSPSDFMAKLGTKASTVYLDVKQQESLGFEFGDKTPWNHFARKNVGFIYAIQHGAEVIFDFDDDNELFNSETKITPPNYDIGEARKITCEKPDAFNVYSVLEPSVPGSWPRGYPLRRILDPCPSTETKVTLKNWAVIQPAANNNPDVDAIYRLTRPIPFNFELNTIPVTFGKHTYVPYNAQTTLHNKNSFWGLLLPCTVHGRVTDIWRSYFAQRIFMEHDLPFVYTAPQVTQFRNPHNILGDLESEGDLYFKSEQLVSFLSNWKPSSNYIPSQMEELYIELYERDYLDEFDIPYLQLWLKSLAAVGYDFNVSKNRN